MTYIKGFIFDLDGVLVDTARYHFIAWQKLAGQLGISFGEKENEQLKGISRQQSLERILAWGNLALPDDRKQALMEEKNNTYLEAVAAMSQAELLKGSLNFLENAREAGLRIGLGSASKNAPLILEKTGITHLFDVVIDGNKTTESKPHPQVFMLGAQALSLEPAEVVVFEDAPAGIEAACKGGFRRVGIGEADHLPGAEIVLRNLGEMSPAAIINQLNFKKSDV